MAVPGLAQPLVVCQSSPVAPPPTGRLVESPCQVGHRPPSLPHLDLLPVGSLRPSAPSGSTHLWSVLGRGDLGFASLWSASCPLLQPQPSGHLHLKARPAPAAMAKRLNLQLPLMRVLSWLHRDQRLQEPSRHCALKPQFIPAWADFLAGPQWWGPQLPALGLSPPDSTMGL